jgi:hypothetical protein
LTTPEDEKCGTAAPGGSFPEQRGRLLHMDQEFFTVKPVATIKYPMKSLNVRYYLSAAVHKFGNVFLRPIYQSRSLGPNGVPKPELGNERSQEPPLHPLAGGEGRGEGGGYYCDHIYKILDLVQQTD